MSVLESSEKKSKLSFLVAIITIFLSLTAIVIVFVKALGMISEERNQIYVIDNGIPLLVKRTSQIENRDIEYKSHINMFHTLFFTLPPDDEFIKSNLKMAMYLVDESGVKQYNNLKEKAFYNKILSSSSVISIKTDSVQLDRVNRKFTYFGTQRIERKSSVLKRLLITEGNYTDIPRSDNNPHGVLITRWKTLLNKDLSKDVKKNY